MYFQSDFKIVKDFSKSFKMVTKTENLTNFIIYYDYKKHNKYLKHRETKRNMRRIHKRQQKYDKQEITAQRRETRVNHKNKVSGPNGRVRISDVQ
jgi:hypothetical protein